MNKKVIYFSLFLRKGRDPCHYAMAYWSLKTLSKFIDNSFDVVLFYDSDIDNFEFEKFEINGFNMFKDFSFVKFIKLNFYDLYKNTEDPFSEGNSNFFLNHYNVCMIKWFGLEKIFNLGYEKILFLDVDTIFNKNPIEIFNTLTEKCIYVNLEQVHRHIILSNYKTDDIITEKEFKNIVLLNRNINNGSGINSGQIYFSEIKIDNFFDLYYKSRLELHNDANQLFFNKKINEKYYKYLTTYSEQWPILLVFNTHKINLKRIPHKLIDRGKISRFKNQCIFHYDRTDAYKILPQTLFTPLIKKLYLKNI